MIFLVICDEEVVVKCSLLKNNDLSEAVGRRNRPLY